MGVWKMSVMLSKNNSLCLSKDQSYLCLFIESSPIHFRNVNSKLPQGMCKEIKSTLSQPNQVDW